MQPIGKVLDFIIEIEKLKAVQRKSKPVGLDRHENSAEHSWRFCLAALMLKDFANAPVEIDRVVRMLLIHDEPSTKFSFDFYPSETLGIVCEVAEDPPWLGLLWV